MALSDEELTELECVVDDYVQEAQRRGFKMDAFVSDFDSGPRGATTCGCLLQAIAFVRKKHWTEALDDVGVDGYWLGEGYDNNHISIDETCDAPELFAMGLRFRERYVGSL